MTGEEEVAGFRCGHCSTPAIECSDDEDGRLSVMVEHDPSCPLLASMTEAERWTSVPAGTVVHWAQGQPSWPAGADDGPETRTPQGEDLRGP